MEEKQRLFLANADDRQTVAGILVKSGYTVRLVKVKVKNTNKICLELWQEKDSEIQ